MSEIKLNEIDFSNQRALQFTSAFYWRLLAGFLFLSWVVNIFLMFTSFLGFGELAILSDLAQNLLRIALSTILFAATAFGVLYILLGSPIKDFAIVLTSIEQTTSGELEPSLNNVFPVWLSIAWRLVGAYLLVSLLVAVVQMLNIGADGLPRIGILQAGLTSLILTASLLYPALFIVLRNIANRRFRHIRTMIVDNE